MELGLNKDLFITGKPILTPYGNVRFLTYYEYISQISNLSTISMNVLHIYYMYKKHADESRDKKFIQLVEGIKEESLYNLVKENEMFKKSYLEVFRLLFESESIPDAIFEEEKAFDECREIIMQMNMLKEEEVSSNPEIQMFINNGNSARGTGEKQSFTDLISSVVVGSFKSYEEVCNMTVLQVYATYYRIGQMKNYDTTVLYSTVAEKVNIEDWNKHIDLFEDKKSGIDKKSFAKTYGNLFG